MTIGEYIKQTDRDTYNRLKLLCRVKADKLKKNIELGDSIENSMKAKVIKE